jgi:hypothetical protein
MVERLFERAGVRLDKEGTGVGIGVHQRCGITFSSISCLAIVTQSLHMVWGASQGILTVA